MAKATRASASEQATGGELANDQAPANSLTGSADGSMDGALSGATGRVRRRLTSGTMILGGVVILSGVSLWSMRAIDRASASGPKSSKEVEALVKEALAQKRVDRPGVQGDPKSFVDATEPPIDLQVPPDQVPKNPFVVYGGPVDEPDTPVLPKTPQGPTIEERIAEWQQSVDDAAATIRVISTMSGPSSSGAIGLANVNGHMMRLGDVFGVDGSDIEFRLDAVERDAITVRAFNAELKHERLVIVNVAKRQ